MSVLHQSENPFTTPFASSEPARPVAGKKRISQTYTTSVRFLRLAVKHNWEAARGRVTNERADDLSLELIDVVAALDPAARRSLRLTVGMLRRLCEGPRPRRRRNGNGHAGPYVVSVTS